MNPHDWMPRRMSKSTCGRRFNSQLVGWLNEWAQWRASGCKALDAHTMRYTDSVPIGGKRQPLWSAVPEFMQSRIAVQVDAAMRMIDPPECCALWCYYVQQMTLERTAMALGVDGRFRARYAIEKAHKSIARALGLPFDAAG
jgi:hypothetical protein